MSRRLALALAVALGGTAGCAAHRNAVWQPPPSPFGTVSDDIVAGLVADGDKAWAARADPAALDEATRAYRAALGFHPDDHGVLLKLARVAFRRGSQGAGAAGYDAAVGWAERALAARNPRLAAVARGRARPGDVFALATPPDAPALALYAEALLGWADANGTATILEARPWIEEAAKRAVALDRSAQWAGADRVLGLLYCRLPPAGQNLRDAFERFEAAVAQAPAYLPNRLAYAQAYAPRVRDAALQRRLLDEIVAADPAALPETLPENREAQARARALLGRP